MSEDLGAYVRRLMKFMDENDIKTIMYPATTMKLRVKPGELPEVVSVEQSKEPPRYEFHERKFN